MPTAPVAVIDVLSELLAAQQNSIIRFMGEGSPYLTRATVELRGLLQRLLAHNLSRSKELYELIERLDGVPRIQGLQPEEQYLAYLSIQFLVPKLIGAKRLLVQRYEDALHALGERAPLEVLDVLRRHLDEHLAELDVLEEAAHAMAGAKA